MTAFLFLVASVLLAAEVYLTALAPTPAGYATTTFVGAMLLFQAALLTQR